MATTLIRGRYVIPGADAPAIEDGGVLVEGSRVSAVGPFAELAARAPQARVVGSERHMVIPGLVNSHTHGRGVSFFQLGFPDDALELWILARRAQRPLDLYWDTMLATINLVESGVTTVLHSHLTRSPRRYEADLDAALGAYLQAGLRVGFAVDIRWNRQFVYQPDQDFAQTLPDALRAELEGFLATVEHVSFDRFCATFDALSSRVGMRGERHRLLYGPIALQWITDDEMRAIARRAVDAGTGLHVHAVETPYQKVWALREYGHSLVRQFQELKALGSLTTLAHCVWLNDDDIDLLASSGTTYVHNPSSNLRLKSGVSPVLRAQARGVNVALGTDSTALNDDDDFVQEMRLAAKLHRLPGVHERDLGSRDALRMATTNGRRVTMFDDVGELVPGGPADLVVLRLDTMLAPFHEPGFDPVDLLLYRGKREHVDTVMVAGEALVEGGRLTKIDKTEVYDALVADAAAAAKTPYRETRRLWAALRPHVERYYEKLWHGDGEPHYGYNSRV